MTDTKMTTEQMVDEAIERKAHETGNDSEWYAGYRKHYASFIERGLSVGDRAVSGAMALTFEGEGTVSVVSNGTETYRGAATQAQLDMILILRTVRHAVK